MDKTWLASYPEALDASSDQASASSPLVLLASRFVGVVELDKAGQGQGVAPSVSTARA